MVLIPPAILAYLISIVVSKGAIDIVCQRLVRSWDSLVPHSKANWSDEIVRHLLQHLVTLLRTKFVYEWTVLRLAVYRSLASNSVVWLLGISSG
jgi:hypothetical protein